MSRASKLFGNFSVVTFTDTTPVLRQPDTSGANYRQHYSMKARRRKVALQGASHRAQVAGRREHGARCVGRKLRPVACAVRPGLVYKTFTFQLPLFIELSPAF